MSTFPIESAPFIFVGNHKVPIVLKWKVAYKLAETMDYNILKLFGDDDQTQNVMMKLMMDPEFLLNLTIFLCNELAPSYSITREDIEDAFPSPASLDTVREAFWASVVNFSNQHLKNILLEGWKEMKKSLKQVSIQSVEQTSLPSDLSPVVST